MFVIELYARSQQKVLPSSLACMRLDSFKSSADDDLRKLPPSRSALREHSKRACYQSGFLWKEALGNVTLPDPNLWGWNFDSVKQLYLPLWQSETCSVTIEKFFATCKCYKQKCTSCKCKGMQCISMCGCKRNCCKVNWPWKYTFLIIGCPGYRVNFDIRLKLSRICCFSKFIYYVELKSDLLSMWGNAYMNSLSIY